MAGAGFDDPAITVMLLVASVVSLVVLLARARAMRPKAAGLPEDR